MFKIEFSINFNRLENIYLTVQEIFIVLSKDIFVRLQRVSCGHWFLERQERASVSGHWFLERQERASVSGHWFLERQEMDLTN